MKPTSLLLLIFLGTVLCLKAQNPDVNSTFTDSRDNKTYKTVKIGEQIWMAENLAYLPKVNKRKKGSDFEPYYYVYDYNGTNVAKAKAKKNYATYGTLYNWTAAKKACPSGWHLPSDAEWNQLEMHLGMSQKEANKIGWRGTNEGSKLKATSGWYNEGNGTNESGFTAVPGGNRNCFKTFSDIGTNGVWWSSTEFFSHAYCRSLNYTCNNVYEDGYDYKGVGRSVRCLKNN